MSVILEKGLSARNTRLAARKPAKDAAGHFINVLAHNHWPILPGQKNFDGDRVSPAKFRKLRNTIINAGVNLITSTR